MKKLLIAGLLLIAAITAGCTSVDEARMENGVIDLPPGKKLVSANRNGNGIPYCLYRERRSDEPVEEYTLQRFSIDGDKNSTIIREH